MIIKKKSPKKSTNRPTFKKPYVENKTASTSKLSTKKTPVSTMATPHNSPNFEQTLISTMATSNNSPHFEQEVTPTPIIVPNGSILKYYHNDDNTVTITFNPDQNENVPMAQDDVVQIPATPKETKNLSQIKKEKRPRPTNNCMVCQYMTV